MRGLDLAPGFRKVSTKGKNHPWPVMIRESFLESVLDGSAWEGWPVMFHQHPDQPPDAGYSIMDGKQRLETLLTYMGRDPRIDRARVSAAPTHFKPRWSDLDEGARIRILGAAVSVVVFVGDDKRAGGWYDLLCFTYDY
jgi:hypothetical protein